MAGTRLELGGLEAVARDLRLPVGLVLDSVKLTAAGGALVFDPFEVHQSKPAAIEIRISEKSIAEFLNRAAPGGLEGFRVRLAGGKAHVEAFKRMLVAIPAKAVCALRIEDQTKLFVDVEEVAAPAPGIGGIVQSQMARLNPIVDTADLPWDVKIAEAVVDAGEVILRGTASPRS